MAKKKSDEKLKVCIVEISHVESCYECEGQISVDQTDWEEVDLDKYQELRALCDRYNKSQGHRDDKLLLIQQVFAKDRQRKVDDYLERERKEQEAKEAKKKKDAAAKKKREKAKKEKQEAIERAKLEELKAKYEPSN
jgi:FKBP-type peptidyl-prolyl cis-trans isomerase